MKYHTVSHRQPYKVGDISILYKGITITTKIGSIYLSLDPKHQTIKITQHKGFYSPYDGIGAIPNETFRKALK